MNGLEHLKCEIAAELGVPNYNEIDKGELTSRFNGKVGGLMVKRLVEIAKEILLTQEYPDLIEETISINKPKLTLVYNSSTVKYKEANIIHKKAL